MIGKALLASAALALAGSAATAGSQAIISKDHMTTMLPHGIESQLPPKLRRPSSGVFDNLATKYTDGLYFCCQGGTITGPDFIGGYSYEQAIPFTPKKSRSVTSITIGLGYVSGTNSAVVSLAADSNGLPGTTLASGGVSSMPDFGTCCTTTTVTISSTMLTKGTQYWIVVSATGNTWTAWNYSTTDQVDEHTYAYNYNGEGWTSASYILYPTAEVN